jgi:hypothetical protein
MGSLRSPQLQPELTRTLLGPNHASLWVVIRRHKCRSTPRRLQIIAGDAGGPENPGVGGYSCDHSTHAPSAEVNVARANRQQSTACMMRGQRVVMRGAPA